MMTEPDVALTDYGLAIESAIFAYAISRRGIAGHPLTAWFLVFFGSIGLASLAGGTVHGFFNEETTAGSAILWPATLIAVGLTALAAWAIAAYLLCSPKVARWITAAAAIELAVYSVCVLLLTDEFWLAVAMYLPAMIFLFVALVRTYRRARDREVFIGMAGLALTFVATLVQQAEIPLHPAYFNHNALYHLIQSVALFMLFWTARFLVGTPRE